MINKVKSIEEAVDMINDGDQVALGGNVLHRAPMAFVRELARKKKKNLKLVKTAGAFDIDLLCAAGCVASVDAGFISYETHFGLAMHYRKAVETGIVKANEHACYTVICALRGAACGAPFMPVSGLKSGDLITHNDYFEKIEDPFGGEPVTVVKSIAPDIAIIHVQECDPKGNAMIKGPKFEDVLISKAAKKVIITAENIVAESRMSMNPEYVDIPYFLVDAVVHAPGGASPCSCDKKYEADLKNIAQFKNLKTPEEIEVYLKSYERKDRMGRRAGGIF